MNIDPSRATEPETDVPDEARLSTCQPTASLAKRRRVGVELLAAESLTSVELPSAAVAESVVSVELPFAAGSAPLASVELSPAAVESLTSVELLSAVVAAPPVVAFAAAFEASTSRARVPLASN